MPDEQKSFFLNMIPAGVTKGGCTKKGHEDWLELDDWSFSMNQSAQPNVKGGRPDKTAASGTFSFTIKHNGPSLFKSCSKGMYIDKPLTFEAERGGIKSSSAAGQKDTGTYFKMVFDRVVVAGRSISGDSGQKTENIVLAFQKVTLTYSQVVDGTLHPVATKSYDSKKNEAA